MAVDLGEGGSPTELKIRPPNVPPFVDSYSAITCCMYVFWVLDLIQEDSMQYSAETSARPFCESQLLCCSALSTATAWLHGTNSKSGATGSRRQEHACCLEINGCCRLCSKGLLSSCPTCQVCCVKELHHCLVQCPVYQHVMDDGHKCAFDKCCCSPNDVAQSERSRLLSMSDGDLTCYSHIRGASDPTL
jgi:hypothetical protein